MAQKDTAIQTNGKGACFHITKDDTDQSAGLALTVRISLNIII